jgi:hypothetical protein
MIKLRKHREMIKVADELATATETVLEGLKKKQMH